MDWLFSKVEGFIDRRHSKKYASLMLKDGYIKHTVNKLSFSEQCYYVFGDVYAPVKKKYDADALQKGDCNIKCFGTCVTLAENALVMA